MEGCQYLQGVQELIPHRYWRMTERPELGFEPQWAQPQTCPAPRGSLDGLVYMTAAVRKEPRGPPSLPVTKSSLSLSESEYPNPEMRKGNEESRRSKYFSGLVLHMQSHPFRNRSEEPFRVLSPPDINIPPETSPGHGLIHLTLESFQVQVTLQLGKKPTLTPDT